MMLCLWRLIADLWLATDSSDADEIIKKRGGRAPVVIPVLLKQ